MRTKSCPAVSYFAEDGGEHRLSGECMKFTNCSSLSQNPLFENWTSPCNHRKN